MDAHLPALMRCAFLLTVLVSACSSVEKPPAKGKGHDTHRELPGPSPAICDPSGCAVYCLRLKGCEGAASCASECAARCGDGFFDDRDGPVMACVLGAADDSCNALRRCCEVEFTSQFCAHQ